MADITTIIGEGSFDGTVRNQINANFTALNSGSSGSILHQATATLDNAQILGKGNVEIIPSPGVDKLVVFAGGTAVMTFVAAGYYTNITSYASQIILTYESSGDQVGLGGWTTELLTSAAPAAVSMTQLLPLMLPDGNDPPNSLVTTVYAVNSDQGVFVNIPNSGSITGGNAGNTLMMSLSYYILNLTTGEFE